MEVSHFLMGASAVSSSLKFRKFQKVFLVSWILQKMNEIIFSNFCSKGQLISKCDFWCLQLFQKIVNKYSAKFRDIFSCLFCKKLRDYNFLLKFPDLYAISKNFWLKNYAVLDSHCDLTSFFHKVWRCYCYADQIYRHYLNFHQKVKIVPDF